MVCAGMIVATRTAIGTFGLSILTRGSALAALAPARHQQRNANIGKT
jgi:hypothetical protein